jgi:hypothetical protein
MLGEQGVREARETVTHNGILSITQHGGLPYGRRHTICLQPQQSAVHDSYGTDGQTRDIP